MRAYLTLKEASELLPSKPAACTLWRWAMKGFRVGGHVVRLRCVWIGKKMFTTADWLDDFIRSVTTAQNALRGIRGDKRRWRGPQRLLPVTDADIILKRAGI